MEAHPLARVTTPFPLWCDGCGCSPTAFRCASGCAYDVCAQCHASGLVTHTVEATRIHGLAAAYKRAHLCDRCGARGTHYSCPERKCEFDVCSSCFDDGTTAHCISEAPEEQPKQRLLGRPRRLFVPEPVAAPC
eukprot:TRINITY_DN11198_c0_g1_i1.p1 TRINITY_DN11198_c0_g1~~TRINITY_DN11198_c0_g1_i1.p1  ORF type:complete len:153 (+),score=33.22 TRINITY_DN11198_c0_g1_i1:58-459(+)